MWRWCRSCGSVPQGWCPELWGWVEGSRGPPVSPWLAWRGWSLCWSRMMAHQREAASDPAITLCGILVRSQQASPEPTSSCACCAWHMLRDPHAYSCRPRKSHQAHVGGMHAGFAVAKRSHLRSTLREGPQVRHRRVQQAPSRRSRGRPPRQPTQR